MYTTSDKEFVLSPCAGSKLSEGRISRPSSNLTAKDAESFADLLTESSFFHEITRFSNITNSDEKAQLYLKEFFGEIKRANSIEDMYIKRKSVNIPLIKSIHMQLSKAFTK